MLPTFKKIKLVLESLTDMKYIFCYCFNRILSRRMGFRETPVFFSNRISSLQLRYTSCDVWDTNKSDLESVKVDKLKPVKTPPFLYTTLSGLVNDYDVLKKLVDLGVNIKGFEKNLQLCGTIIKLDYEEHVVPFLQFLIQHGVPAEELGNFISKNPNIFLSDIDNLQVRVNYLLSKKFDKEMIASIITNYPKWLSHSVSDVNSCLSQLQNTLHLSGNEVREIVVALPSIITVKHSIICSILSLFRNTFALDNNTIKSIIIKTPRLLRRRPTDIRSTYSYLKEDMSISDDIIIAQPKVLLYRVHFIKPKHLFLEKLGRNQYDPKLPGYIPLHNLLLANDEHFAEEIAMSTVKLYYDFQRTL